MGRNDKINSKISDAAGDSVCVSPGDGFIYIPAGESGALTDASGSFLLALKLTKSALSYGEPVLLGLLELDGKNRFYEIGMTKACEQVSGCCAQWLGKKHSIIYNDIKEGNPCAVVYNMEAKKPEKILPGIISAVSSDGSFALGFDAGCRKRLSPDKPAVVRYDIESGKISGIISFDDIADSGNDGAVHSITGLRISPDGKNIMFVHRINEGGKETSRLMTADISGRKVRRLGDELDVRYADWSADDEVTGSFSKNGGVCHYYSIRLFDNIPHLLWAELDNAGRLIPLSEKGVFAGEIYDEKKKIILLYLLTRKDKRSRLIAADTAMHSVALPENGCLLHICTKGGKKSICRLEYTLPDLERYDSAAERNHSVTVVLATYNGERFLKEQLDSLLGQKGVRVSILVRDDGSGDGTQNILDDYQSRGLLKWYTGEHLNVQKGYMELLKNAPVSDYYAFCDQDDVWDEDKLLAAVTELDDMDNTRPAMYYCGQKLVDEKLELLSVHCVYTARNPHTNFFFSNVAGCTAVFNQKLLDELNSAEPEFIHSHDNWALKVCLAMGGEFFADPVARICYRQHGGNVVGLNVGIKGRYRQVKRYMSIKLRKQCENLLICYGGRMTQEYKKIAEDICNYDISLKNRFSLLKDSDVDFKNRGFNAVIKMKVLLRKL